MVKRSFKPLKIMFLTIEIFYLKTCEDVCICSLGALILCSYITLPLYALVTQVISKQKFFDILVMWPPNESSLECETMKSCVDVWADGFTHEESSVWWTNGKGIEEVAQKYQNEERKSKEAPEQNTWWFGEFQHLPLFLWNHSTSFQNHWSLF